MDQVKLFALIAALTVLSGLADSRGFVHAARIWQEGQVVWREVGKSALGFAVGIGIYWVSLRYFRQAGVLSPAIQTAAWFGVCLVGVALADGQFVRWSALDQAAAVVVLVGIGWLMVRAGGDELPAPAARRPSPAEVIRMPEDPERLVAGPGGGAPCPSP